MQPNGKQGAPTAANEPSAPFGGERIELKVGGMTCQNCARHVREALEGVAFVRSATVHLEEGRASVKAENPGVDGIEALVRAVEDAGFKAAWTQSNEGGSETAGASEWSPLSGWRFNVVAGSAVTVILMAAEWGLQAGEERWYHWLAFVLALPIQVIGGSRFYRGAWNQLKVGSSNMDTLVALGSSTAFLYSCWGLFAGWPGHLYFMESAAIISLISVGHWLEAKASARAAGSLRALLDLAPQMARRLDDSGREVEALATELRAGERIVLRPGDQAPSDAEVLEGRSSFDESMLTGESLPVEKAPGQKIYAGTVNQDGRLVARVTATGEATALARIIEIVQRAQSSRASIQRLGDRVSAVFVPIVVALALGTGLAWGFATESMTELTLRFAPFFWTPHLPASPLASAVYHAAAVLIIACPCAMGLATPAAIMAGTNAAARRGILIRDGAALEKSGKVTAVMFDKTGTLTDGRLTVAAAERTDESAVEWKRLAASLAGGSNHPLSKAVAELTAERVPLKDWRERRGSGVEARVSMSGLGGGAEEAEGEARLGSLDWLKETGVEASGGADFVDHWRREGATVVGLAHDARLLGLIALKDGLKADAADVVEGLKRQGKNVFMITGDHSVTAAAIARQAGIRSENVFAEVLPERKAEIVRQVQAQGERVAFVGDGINDAPALETADLGVAVSRASDVAREAADIVLLKSDIRAIPEAIEMAQATLRTIKQNLFWAFFYNAAAIPLAMFGFLSPVVSAAAMGLSDIIVIGNALRLNWSGRRN